MKGMGTSAGKTKGKVRIIKNIEDYANFNEGDILVVNITNPTMVAIMNKAAGIICEIGNIVSHPSIISRELGIPCIVSVKNATKILKDGDIVHMDGDKRYN